MSDTYSYERNRPAEITPTSSRDQLVATAMYLSGRIARLLGVEEIPLDQLDINWAELDEAAGRYRPARTIFDDPDLDLDRVTIRNWPSPTKVLAHELAHAYMLNGGRAEKGQGWVQESLADYVTTRLGFIEGIQEQPDDPKLGYTAGSRFLAWLDEFSPGAGMAFTKLMSTGLIGASEAAQKVTGHPLEYLLAAYEETPFIEDPEQGPLARMLRNRADMSFLGQRAMDTYLKKSQMFMRQVEKAKKAQAREERVGVSERLFNRWWQLSGEKWFPDRGNMEGTRATKPGPDGHINAPSEGGKGVVREPDRPIHKAPPATSEQLR